MMKRLLLCAVLASSLAGCRILGGPRPTPDTCPEPGPVPTPPAVSTLPLGAVPPPGASHVVGLLCQETGAFMLAGVNLPGRTFTYVVKGQRDTREALLSHVYKAGVPVVLYTSPVKVAGGTRTSAAVTSGATSGSADGDTTLDPCHDGTEIGDPPPDDPKDQGNATAPPLEAFARLAWYSASAIDGVSDPAAAPPRTAPGTTVPR
jgi:hypothetical protein